MPDMPELGKSSSQKLATCHPDLQIIFYGVIKITDYQVITGVRDEAAQNEAYEKGFSKVKWPDGKHNVDTPEDYSKAIDVAPWPIDWKDARRFYYLAGVVMAKADEYGIALRWGGDWDGDGDLSDQRFNDLGHFELI